MTDQARDTDAQSEQERARAYREQLKQLHAADLGHEMALSLVSFGSQKLGLTDETAELRDLDDARLSIELLRVVVDVLERQSARVPAGELRETLAQLQLAYAHAVQLAAAPAAGAEPEAGAEEPKAPEAPPEEPAAEEDGLSEADSKPDAG